MAYLTIHEYAREVSNPHPSPVEGWLMHDLTDDAELVKLMDRQRKLRAAYGLSDEAVL